MNMFQSYDTEEPMYSDSSHHNMMQDEMSGMAQSNTDSYAGLEHKDMVHDSYTDHNQYSQHNQHNRHHNQQQHNTYDSNNEYQDRYFASILSEDQPLGHDFIFETEEDNQITQSFYEQLCHTGTISIDYSNTKSDTPHNTNMNTNVNTNQDDDYDNQSLKRQKTTNESYINPNSNSNLAESDRVAEHYSSRKDAGIRERKNSPILFLKYANNWIKATLITMFLNRSVYDYPILEKAGLSILDLCGGKGGDLRKFFTNYSIRLYTLADIAPGSVKDAVKRFSGTQLLAPTRALFICANLGKVRLHNVLDPRIRYDVVSCQFSLHYCFSDESHARMVFQNIADRLRPGGYFFATIPDSRILVEKLRQEGKPKFGNSVYHVEFDDTRPKSEHEIESGIIDEEAERLYWNNREFTSESPFGQRYTFFLLDAVENVPEYLVHYETMCQLAHEYGLRPIFRESFHSYYTDRVLKPSNFEQPTPSIPIQELKTATNTNIVQAMSTSTSYSTNIPTKPTQPVSLSIPFLDDSSDKRSLHHMKVFPPKTDFPADQWEALGIYCAVAFQKLTYNELDVPTPQHLQTEANMNIHGIAVGTTVPYDELESQIRKETIAFLERDLLHIPNPANAPQPQPESVDILSNDTAVSGMNFFGDNMNTSSGGAGLDKYNSYNMNQNQNQNEQHIHDPTCGKWPRLFAKERMMQEVTKVGRRCYDTASIEMDILEITEDSNHDGDVWIVNTTATASTSTATSTSHSGRVAYEVSNTSSVDTATNTAVDDLQSVHQPIDIDDASAQGTQIHKQSQYAPSYQPPANNGDDDDDDDDDDDFEHLFE